MQPSESSFPAIPPPSEPKPAPAPRRRPFGLYVILILLSLQALLGVVVTGLLGLGLAFAAEDASTALRTDIASILETFGIMLMTSVVMVGLWRYRLWAWYGMMLLLAYWMATDAIAYFRSQPDYFSMLLNVVLVFYLNQLEVKVLFEARPQPDGASI